MHKGSVAITTTTFGQYSKEPLELCKNNGLKVIMNPYHRKITSDELVGLAHNSIGIIAGTETISKEVLLQLPSLKVISRCGSGMDNVDTCFADTLGIKVFNTPYGPTKAVVELTVGLILNILRKVTEMDTKLKNGEWSKLMGNLLLDKKVGVVGFGRIGREVGSIVDFIGANVSYCDIKPTQFINCELKTLDELLKWADVITIHVSSSDEIIGYEELKLMKKGSWLINTSRGGVVNEKHLYDMLKIKHIAGAAIDVFEQEPYNGPLKELKNVILTPHIGSYAEEGRIKMENKAVRNLIEGLNA